MCQFVFSNYWSYKLCDIFAALVSAGAIILLNRVWSPGEATVATPVIAGGSEDVPDAAFERRVGRADSGGDRLKAFAPYIIIVVLFSVAQITSVKTWLTTHGVWTFDWPGLHVLTPKGKPANTAYVLNYLGATGTLLFVSGLLTLVVLRMTPLAGLRTYGETIRQFGWAIFTIFCVFALSYVMNLSGQISSLGVWLAKAGAFFAFLSPVVGWFGVTITGTDAGSNALFGNLQVTAAHQLTRLAHALRRGEHLRRRDGQDDLPAEPRRRHGRGRDRRSRGHVVPPRVRLERAAAAPDVPARLAPVHARPRLDGAVMNRRRFLASTAAAAAATGLGASGAGAVSSKLPGRADVVRTLRKVNDHWIGANKDPGNNQWARATYMGGDLALYRLTEDQRYLDYARGWAEKWSYALNTGVTTRHADNQCAGQAYLDLYELEPEQAKIAQIEESLRLMVEGTDPAKDDDWWWVDALHMAMPPFARVGALLGDTRYWTKMDAPTPTRGTSRAARACSTHRTGCGGATRDTSCPAGRPRRTGRTSTGHAATAGPSRRSPRSSRHCRPPVRRSTATA